MFKLMLDPASNDLTHDSPCDAITYQLSAAIFPKPGNDHL